MIIRFRSIKLKCVLVNVIEIKRQREYYLQNAGSSLPEREEIEMEKISLFKGACRAYGGEL